MAGLIHLHSDDTSKTKAHEAKASKGGNSPDVSDAVVFAFFLLTESIQIQSESTLNKAKALEANAQAEQSIISKLKELKWNSVPQVQKKTDRHTHWHSRAVVTPDGGGTVINYKTYSYTSHVVNGTQIANANAANAEGDKMRQDMQTQLATLQQNAQIGDTMVNSTVNEMTQTTQEASGLATMLKTLTNKILRPNLG